jgi:mRNA-degrading endonuclease YafQ of YafQ-DinJ toxin-antitoxin module
VNKYQLISTRQFDRRLLKFRRAHPELTKQLVELLKDLEEDPFQPHLRLHPLKGKLKGLHAVRLTLSIRITLTLKFRPRQVILLDLGSHDEVYR